MSPFNKSSLSYRFFRAEEHVEKFRTRVIHNGRVAFVPGSNASVFDLVQLLELHSLSSLSVLLGTWTRSQKSSFHQIYN
jgi:hypothetical protein